MLHRELKDLSGGVLLNLPFLLKFFGGDRPLLLPRRLKTITGNLCRSTLNRLLSAFSETSLSHGLFASFHFKCPPCIYFAFN